MISVIVIIALVLGLLLIARRSSKNRDTILIEVLLGIAGSVLAALAVASFPKMDTGNFLSYLDTRIYEVVFGKKADDTPQKNASENKIVSIKKNVSSGDRKIEGVYAGLIRSLQNGSDVLSEKAYVLRVDPARNEKILEIYQGGEIEYAVRIDGELEKDGVTWVGETKSVLKGGGFIQDDLKLLLSPEAGRIDWHQHDKIQQIESIGILYKIDQAAVSERISAVNRIKNTMFICKEESAREPGDASQFLFIPVLDTAPPETGGVEPAALYGLSYSDKLYGDIISGAATPYEGPYDIHFKTRFKSRDFRDLTGMKRLKPDLASLMGFFDKGYDIGVNRPDEQANWFTQSGNASQRCKVSFVVFQGADGQHTAQ